MSPQPSFKPRWNYDSSVRECDSQSASVKIIAWPYPEIQVDSRSRAAYLLGIWLMVFPLWPQFPVWENSGPNVTGGKEHSLGARWNWISSSFWSFLAECLRKRLLPALQVPPRSLCRVVRRVGVTCLAHRCSVKRIFCWCPKHDAAAICMAGEHFP